VRGRERKNVKKKVARSKLKGSREGREQRKTEKATGKSLLNGLSLIGTRCQSRKEEMWGSQIPGLEIRGGILTQKDEGKGTGTKKLKTTDTAIF